MLIYDLTNSTIVTDLKKDWFNLESDFFLICSSREMKKIESIFQFDPYTVLECVNLDENIRFDSYSGYDFISLIYFYFKNSELRFKELNIYIGKNYIILVLHDDEMMSIFIPFFKNQTMFRDYKKENLINIYYKVFHKILTDLFSTLEQYEDILSLLQTEIINKADKKQLTKILETKSVSSRIKKHLRPLLYIGDQIIINENDFIPKDKIKFFKNIDMRMNKLYDFAVNISEMSDQLIQLYDSKINMQTNEIVTRLTIITVFIGPLTVITGIYGMNFDFMPELSWAYGYPAIILLMVFVSAALYFYLKKNKYF